MAGKKPTPDVLSRAISDLDEPVLFKNLINKDDEGNWRLLELDSLVELMKDKPLPFRVGKNARTDEPQWEIDCETEMMTLDDLSKKDYKDNWYYFDYKYMHEWFSNESKLLDDFNWKLFGVDKTGRDSTLWIGSKGAHTNCHQDSYGCNLIAQLHGRKEWLLFPPESGKILRQTRIPYEESTVYSKFNFFSPRKEDEEVILEVEKCPGVVVLEPGDVLFVPRGWWHFVESLELSISVNVWLPLINDSESRLKEALVKLIITRIGEELPSTNKSESSLEDSIKLIEKCLEECNNSKPQDSCCSKKIKLTTYTQEELSTEYPHFIKKINYLDKKKLKEFLVKKRERFIENFETKKNVLNLNNDDLSYKNSLEAVVTSICHSDVIDKIADLLLIDK